jgi:hypothetical protein
MNPSSTPSSDQRSNPVDTATDSVVSALADHREANATPPFQRVPTSPEPTGFGARAASIANEAHSAIDAAAGAGEDVIARVVSDLHETVDGVADRAEPMASRLEEASQVSRQWMDAAREVIRERPLVAMSGALLIGAAVLHLVSSSRQP